MYSRRLKIADTAAYRVNQRGTVFEQGLDYAVRKVLKL